MRLLLPLLLCTALLASVQAFYLPGVAPRAYMQDEALPLLVNRLDSAESIVPYDYYHFDFCEPGGHEGAKVSENLGQVVLGERIRHSPYHIQMLRDQPCAVLCSKTYKYSNNKDVAKYKRIRHAIQKDYMHHWIMDNLPAVECTQNCRGGANPDDQPFYRLGFPVGCAIGDAQTSMTICSVANILNLHANEVFINNHVDIIISYHKSPEFTGHRIVGIEVRPRSRGHEDENAACNVPHRNLPPQPFTLNKENPELTVVYSYSVTFQSSEIKWASRWDTYLRSAENTSIHWFSIVNSLIIVIFLSGMVGVILVRTLHKDISRYNQLDNTEEAQEEFGWKLVHGDVFRPPQRPMLLSVCLGSGTQVCLMLMITLFFACLGFLSPATRGGLMTAMLVLWVCLGTPGGYVAAVLYKSFGGEQWKSCVMTTSFLFPGLIFGIFFFLNLILWSLESSAAVPFGTLIALIALWFCVSVPLTFFGAYLGFKKPQLENPVRTNQIPRQIPPQSIYTRPIPSFFMGGVLPFGCIFIQLFFLLNSIWGHKLYYVFGFLAIVFVILLITTVESTILLCYFHLCAEDYHWWWRAFLTGASSAFYLFAFSIVFYFKRMEVEGTVNLVLYAGYTLLVTIVFALVTGTVGFFGTYAFVRKIYSVVKVD